MDARTEDWITGLAFARSGSDSSWTRSNAHASVSGLVESDVSAMYPYFRGRWSEGLEVWSFAGWGTGTLESAWTDAADPDGEPFTIAGDLRMSLAAVGAVQSLYRREGFSVSLLGDTGYSSLALDGRDAMTVRVHRTRLGVEGRYASEDDALTATLRVRPGWRRRRAGPGGGARRQRPLPLGPDRDRARRPVVRDGHRARRACRAGGARTLRVPSTGQRDRALILGLVQVGRRHRRGTRGELGGSVPS